MPMIATLLALALGRGDLESVRAAHALALVERGEAALGSQLFLDAERCLLEARAWNPPAEGIEAGLDRLMECRRASVQETREAYQAFLASDQYARSRREHLEKLEELRQRSGHRVLSALKTAVLGGDADSIEQATFLAFELDAEPRLCERVLGKQRLTGFRTRWEASRGLSRLELGPRFAGPPPAPAFTGRVVVWRNFSL